MNFFRSFQPKGCRLFFLDIMILSSKTKQKLSKDYFVENAGGKV